MRVRDPILVQTHATGERSEYILDGETSVGRAQENTIVLADASVSRYHAVIRRDDAGGHVVVDLGSANGTLVDRQGSLLRVMLPVHLSHGDCIVIGNHRLAYAHPQASPTEADEKAGRGAEESMALGSEGRFADLDSDETIAFRRPSFDPKAAEKEAERRHIRQVMADNDGDLQRGARVLGISAEELSRKLLLLGL